MKNQVLKMKKKETNTDMQLRVAMHALELIAKREAVDSAILAENTLKAIKISIKLTNEE